VVWKATYAPFGQATVDADPDGDGTDITLNLRFPGQYHDDENHMNYNYFRYYQPAVGRYLRVDPLGLKAGSNPFSYGEENPTGYLDYFALCKVEVRYKELFQIIGLGYPIGVYHAFIVTTGRNGAQKYYRAGPSRAGVFGNWGGISPRYGDYMPGTPDWTTKNVPSTLVIDNEEPCACYQGVLKSAMDDIEKENIPYNPLGPNSNTTASYGLQRLGVGNMSPHVLVPGWGMPLLQ